jgi:soluble lytic murein transglycosylase
MVLVGAAIALMLLVPLLVDWVHTLRIERNLDAHLPRIRRHAEARGLPVKLVVEVVRAESGGDPLAVSPVNARGLMQIMPATERDLVDRLGVPQGNVFDPDHNLLLGTTYLKHLMDRFDGDVTLVLAAYHMGPTKLARHRREHPQLSSEQLVARFAGPKTRAYVRNILSRLDHD